MLCEECTGRVTFDLGIALLSPLWKEGADVTMASIPKVLDGQSYSSTGEEVTQPMTVEQSEQQNQRSTERELTL